MKEALLYEPIGGNRVRCGLCAHRCVIKEDATGFCGVRINRKGRLYSAVYEKVISASIDPIEKKPLFHFQPGSGSLSIATMGCNMKCDHCQNFEISQPPAEAGEIRGRSVEPDQLVESAIEAGCTSISYTYTEPTVFFELASETAEAASKRGLKNVFVTNGYMTRETLEAIDPHLHGANVDLKSFRDGFYKEQCGARLEPVLDTIRAMKQSGIWVEVTTLIIPDLNDSEAELDDIASFIAETGTEIPWHISAFHHTYRMRGHRSTPVGTLHRAREIGLRKGLRYVYCGNVPGEVGENTVCYQCGETLIERYGFRVVRNRIEGDACPACDSEIDGVALSSANTFRG
ncbi:AmmeMemoRadiSam system radical SAM enzyme [Thermodesulfobacteriota bacterium]